MKSVLQGFYEGEHSSQRRMAPMTEEYRDSYEAFCKGREDLMKRLHEMDPELEKKLSNLLDELKILGALDRENMFCCGFSLGMRLLSEALYYA